MTSVAAALQQLATVGGGVAASAAEAARGADFVITMLPAGEHVRDVWLHQGGLIEAVQGTKPLLIDCSTIDVESARTVTAAAEQAGLEMLDAPVSGGTAGAAAGTLTFMVGGSEAAFERGRPILPAMGRNIFLAGGPGAGQAAKICNNMMLAINMVGVSEGFLLAQKLGLDWDKLHADRQHLHQPVLGAEQLLSGAGPGAGGAVEPRLRARVHGRADAEGCEAVAGGGGRHRIADAARGACRCHSTRRWWMPATAARISRWYSAGWRDRNDKSRGHDDENLPPPLEGAGERVRSDDASFERTPPHPPPSRGGGGVHQGEPFMSAEAFKSARDFLFAHRTDYETAHAEFRWPHWSISTTRSTGSTPNSRAARWPISPR